MILYLLFLSFLLYCCNSSKSKVSDAVIPVEVLGNENSFGERELLKGIFKQKNLLRILLKFLDRNLPVICGSFVNKRVLEIYKEAMIDNPGAVYSLAEILILSATHVKFNAAFREELAENNPNRTTLLQLHQHRLESQKPFGTRKFQDYVLPQKYVELLESAYNIRRKAANILNPIEQEQMDLWKILIAKTKTFIVHLLVLLASIAVYATNVAIPFDSFFGVISRLGCIIFYLLMFIAIHCSAPKNVDAKLPNGGMTTIMILLIGLFCSVSILIGSTERTFGIYVFSLMFFGIYFMIPIIYFSARIFFDYLGSLLLYLQIRNNLQTEKQILNKNEQNFQKYLFLN